MPKNQKFANSKKIVLNLWRSKTAALLTYYVNSMRLVVINKNACFIIPKKHNSINPSHKQFVNSMELVIDQIVSSSMKKELCSRTKEIRKYQINLNQDSIEEFADSEPNV